MARFRIIVLDQSKDDPNTYRIAMWADVPSARQVYYANAAAVSVWKDAITADNTALQSGSVVERVITQRVTLGSTLVQIEAVLQVAWTAFQAEITAANPWVRYGSTWDGTSWSVQNGG